MRVTKWYTTHDVEMFYYERIGLSLHTLRILAYGSIFDTVDQKSSYNECRHFVWSVVRFAIGRAKTYTAATACLYDSEYSSKRAKEIKTVLH